MSGATACWRDEEPEVTDLLADRQLVDEILARVHANKKLLEFGRR